MNHEIKFRNRSLFFIPFSITNYEKKKSDAFSLFNCIAAEDARWETVRADEFTSAYLMPYISDMISDFSVPEKDRCMMTYRLRDLSLCSPLYLHGFEDKFSVSEVRISVFGTQIGFVEWWIDYGNSDNLEEIESFSYLFKKACPRIKSTEERESLYDVTKSLIPAPEMCRLFFNRPSNEKNRYKYECNCFHMIRLCGHSYEGEYMREHLQLLCRSYNSLFNMNGETGDMFFMPYNHIGWSGSQESIATICYEPDEDAGEKSWTYIDNYYSISLENDYRLIYLILLNQKYAGISYISQISQNSFLSARNLEKMNEMVTRLKTTYSFRIASDDLIIQSIYKKMYEIFDIDNLLSDIRDNEDQISIVKTISSEKHENKTNIVLTAISILTLFSVMIDASSFFDRFSGGEMLHTIISVIIVFIALSWAISRIIKLRK